MRLAAAYSIFSGLELLEGSIQQIYDHVDVVIICYQNISNRGNASNRPEELAEELSVLYEKVIVSRFSPDLSKSTKDNERSKLQQRIDLAKNLNCTHYIGMATDHYFKSDEFARAKQVVITNDWDVTLTKMFTYYKSPQWQLTPIEDYCAPFICKLYTNTIVTPANNYPSVVDPSVRICPVSSYHEFGQGEIMLHHFSMVRKDIREKFENAAASVNWMHKIEGFIEEYNNYNMEENPGVSYFRDRKIRVVPNYFNL